MSLIYRTMWEDDRADIAERAFTIFQTWAREKSEGALEVPETGVEASPDQDVRIVRVDAARARAVIMTHHHRLPSGTWTLSCRVIVGERNWVWVDVERTADDPFGPRPQIVAPRIVQRLIRDGHAQVGGISLRTRPVVIGRDAIDGLARLLLSPQRQLPLVVFSFDTTLTGAAWSERLSTVAQHLAGLALVIGLEPDTDKLLERRLPEGLGVFGGAVRTYMPGDADSAAMPWRHRWLGATKLRGPVAQVAQTLANHLASSATLRMPPHVYETQIRPVLWHSEHHVSAVVDLDRELEATRRRVETLERQRFELNEDLAVHLLGRARSAWTWATRSGSDRDVQAGPLDPRWTSPDLAFVIDRARAVLPNVDLQPPSRAAVASIEAAPQVESRLLRLWLAMVSVEAYCRTDPRPDGFREWCGLGVPNTWDPALLIDESDTRSEHYLALRISRSDDDAGVLLRCTLHPNGRASVVLEAPDSHESTT